MTIEKLRELEAKLDDLIKERAKRHDEIKKLSKEELLRRIDQRMRIHSLTTKDPKIELVYGLLDAELPTEGLTKSIRRLNARLS